MVRSNKEERRRGKRWQRGALHVKGSWASSPMACRIIERLRSHGSPKFAPTRLVNVSSWAVIETAGISTEYMALSYVWTQHPDRESLRRTVQEAMRHTGIGYGWIDAMCVKQDDPDDLAREIPEMGLYYERAAGVLAVVPELQTAMMQLADPLGGKREGWVEGPKSDAYRLTHWLEARYRQLGRQLRVSKWSQRVWTFQEAVLNEQTIVWNGWGFCSMEDLAVAQIVEALGERATSITRLVKKLWTVNTKGGPSAEATTWNPFLRHIMTPKVELADLPTLWNYNKERQCGREEDLVYGYMGLVSDLPDNVAVDYGLGFEGVYDRLMRGRAVNLTVMCSLPSAASGKCWMPRVKDNRLEVEADGHPPIVSSGLVGNGGLLQVEGFMATLVSANAAIVVLKTVRETNDYGKVEKGGNAESWSGLVSGRRYLTQEQLERHTSAEVLCVKVKGSGVDSMMVLVGRRSGNRFHREETMLVASDGPADVIQSTWEVGLNSR